MYSFNFYLLDYSHSQRKLVIYRVFIIPTYRNDSFAKLQHTQSKANKCSQIFGIFLWIAFGNLVLPFAFSPPSLLSQCQANERSSRKCSAATVE